VTVPTSPPATTSLTAPPVVAGFDGKTITLINLGTRSNQAFGPIGRNINGAFTAHFNAINKKGGIAGKYPVRIEFVETNYDPATATSAYQSTKNRAVGYGSILGTPIVAALLPALEADNITAAPASQDAEWAKRPVLLPIGTTYQVQAINGSSYWWETAGKDQTLCGLSVTTGYGATGTEGLRYSAASNQATLGPILELNPTETPDAYIGRLAGAGCKAVYLTTTPQQAIRAVVAAAAAGYRPRWIWMSATWNDAVLTPSTSALLETTSWVVGEGPAYEAVPSKDNPGLYRMANELRANDGGAYVDQANIGTLFGWCQALVWEALLERAVTNNDLSRVGIQTAAKQLGSVDLAGLIAPTDFASPNRNARAVNTIFVPNGSYLLGLFPVRTNYTSTAAESYGK
jgi:ABC-type branched-subunit amino acid transport system substrate-binding protein